tara:strand:+ start:3280 stop:3558 length:279 start_codon:yes stop_codon:yes gene_type:complete
MTELERDVEQYFSKVAKQIGALTYKWPASYHKGLPDRILILSSGDVWFVEIKRTLGRVSKRQKYVLETLRKQCCKTAILSGKSDVDEFFLNI